MQCKTLSAKPIRRVMTQSYLFIHLQQYKHAQAASWHESIRNVTRMYHVNEWREYECAAVPCQLGTCFLVFFFWTLWIMIRLFWWLKWPTFPIKHMGSTERNILFLSALSGKVAVHCHFRKCTVHVPYCLFLVPFATVRRIPCIYGFLLIVQPEHIQIW